MGVDYIVLGYAGPLLFELEHRLPARSVMVLEEPALIEAYQLADYVPAFRCVHSLVPAPVRRDELCDEIVSLTAGADTARAVLPGVEYAVVVAAALAEARGLAGAGVRAARAMRDKVRLREAAGGSVRQPDWSLVQSVDDVAAFRDAHGGRCVLKPTDRQSSLGVQLLGPDDDLELAWRHTTQADEPQLQRAPEWIPDRYVVEERLDGPEISVEGLVHDGELVFVNITGKQVLPGRHPVEIGHVIPAAISESTRAAVVAAMEALVAATGFAAGVLHGEWILVGGTEPHLVECCGRMPGDEIARLIDLAHGGSLVEDWLAVLSGEAPSHREQTPGRGAAVRFLEGGPGLVTSVTGVAAVRRLEGVEALVMQTAVGERLRVVESSWDRPGRVVVSAQDGPAAQRLADEAAGMVCITVAP